MELKDFPKFALESCGDNFVGTYKPASGTTRYLYPLTKADAAKALKLGYIKKENDGKVWVSGKNFSGIVQFGQTANWDKPIWMNFKTKEGEIQKKASFIADKLAEKKQVLSVLVQNGVISQKEMDKRLDDLMKELI